MKNRNLNRMTATPKVIPIGSKTSWAYTNNILGNRTGRNYTQDDASAAYYTWDVLNRMLMQATPSAGGTYHYRADGQRIEKIEGPTLDWVPPPNQFQSGHYDLNYGTDNPSARYFYDGQMGIEDDYNPSGTVTVVNRYALGARGIDRVEKYADSTTTYGYPLYDGHGNMRTTLARSGSSYSTGTFKTYDVWGSVRSGGDSGDPAQKYVANLGHVNDPESGLIYMRARYHEPATGRFISEDPARDGANWFVYCANDPVGASDRSGREWTDDAAWNFGRTLLAFGQFFYLYGFGMLVKATASFYALMALRANTGTMAPRFETLIKARQTAMLGEFGTAALFISVGLGVQWVGKLYMALGADVDSIFPAAWDFLTEWIPRVRQFLPGGD